MKQSEMAKEQKWKTMKKNLFPKTTVAQNCMSCDVWWEDVCGWMNRQTDRQKHHNMTPSIALWKKNTTGSIQKTLVSSWLWSLTHSWSQLRDIQVLTTWESSSTGGFLHTLGLANSVSKSSAFRAIQTACTPAASPVGRRTISCDLLSFTMKPQILPRSIPQQPHWTGQHRTVLWGHPQGSRRQGDWQRGACYRGCWQRG